MIGVFSNIIRFVALVLVQVLVLDHLDLANGRVVPYLYVLFILMLPFELPSWAQLILAALLGLVVDMFGSTPGMHMSACVVMAYARIHLLNLLAPREGYEFGMRPTLPRMGSTWFITYAGLLIVIHHIWLFFIEVYRFTDPGTTLLRAMLSSAFTLVLCLLAQLLTSREDKSRS